MIDNIKKELYPIMLGLWSYGFLGIMIYGTFQQIPAVDYVWLMLYNMILGWFILLFCVTVYMMMRIDEMLLNDSNVMALSFIECWYNTNDIKTSEKQILDIRTKMD